MTRILAGKKQTNKLGKTSTLTGQEHWYKFVFYDSFIYSVNIYSSFRYV